MNIPYDFPRTTAYGKFVAKNKIYERASASGKVKELFVKQVEKIIWSYKLSPETTNLPSSENVQEIQVITIFLKTDEISLDVLRAIDKSIPSPLLFYLKLKNKFRYAACYKRCSESDKSKWVISDYFYSAWFKDDAPLNRLPVVLSMGELYQSILEQLIPISLKKRENIGNAVARAELIREKERAVEKLEKRINREKQFNRRVELNHTLNDLKKDIEKLKN